MTVASALRQASSLFHERFASRPSVAASAPGRINLLGEHTDYNGGPTLPFAIERRTAVVAAPAGEWQAISALDGVLIPFDPAAPPTGTWTDYPRGVARVMLRSGISLGGARIAVASALPIGAGLSSSAALCLASAKALALMAGRKLTAEALIEFAWTAEHDEVGVPCGRLDQTAIALGARGSAILFETGPGTVAKVPMSERIWVIETGVSRRLVDGEYARRRHECTEALAMLHDRGVRAASLADLAGDPAEAWARILPPPLESRVRHVVSEVIRTRAAAAALRAGDLTTLGRLLVEGHHSLRDHFQSSCPEADALVARITELGGLGARLTGAGWGGAVIALLPEGQAPRIVAQLEESRGSGGGDPVWSTRSAAGVRREALD